MNKDNAFSSLNVIACNYQRSVQFQFYQDTDKPEDIGFLETLENQIY